MEMSTARIDVGEYSMDLRMGQINKSRRLRSDVGRTNRIFGAALDKITKTKTKHTQIVSFFVLSQLENSSFFSLEYPEGLLTEIILRIMRQCS